MLVLPLKLVAGPEFQITAEAGDQRCTVSRFVLKPASVEQKQCSCKLDDVLQTIAAMGGQYTDAVEFLRAAQRNKCLTCAIAFDALPSATPIELLAACGSDATKFKDHPDFQQDVLAAQEELGMAKGQGSGGAGGARSQR
jgi:hypothetical protein